MGTPSDVSKQLKSKNSFLDILSAIMLLVVIDALISIITGSLFVGKAKAIGSGVKSAFVPPNGATVAEEGTELLIIGTKPLLTIGSIYAASAPLW